MRVLALSEDPAGIGALATSAGFQSDAVTSVEALLERIADIPEAAAVLIDTPQEPDTTALATLRQSAHRPVLIRILRAGLGHSGEHYDAVAVRELPMTLSIALRAARERCGLLGELGAVRQNLGNAATHDLLTGCWNRQGVLGWFWRELARGVRRRAALGVVLADIDNFKAINDRFGHLVGDDVLRAVGARLCAAVRPFDLVGRYGGEEFLVLLPSADLAATTAIADRLRERIAQPVDNLARNAPAPVVSASFGVTAAENFEDTLPAPAELLAAADRALYRAKREGRNRVCTQAVQAPPSDAADLASA